MIWTRIRPRRFRPPFPQAALLTLLLLLVCAGARAETPGRLRFLHWEGRLLGHVQPGTACWIDDGDGSLRLEVLPDGRTDLGPVPLLRQAGEGFTLVLGPQDVGTINAWGRSWRPLPTATGHWVRFLAGWLDGRSPENLTAGRDLRLLASAASAVAPRPRCLPRTGAGKAWRIQLPALEESGAGEAGPSSRKDAGPAGTFRREMAHRAAGRGGGREVLTLTPADAHRPGAWILTSSRKPGRLRLEPVATWPVGSVFPEVFVPLWPLEQLLDREDFFSGTPGPGSG